MLAKLISIVHTVFLSEFMPLKKISSEADTASINGLVGLEYGHAE